MASGTKSRRTGGNALACRITHKTRFAVADSRSLPLSIGLVPLRVAFDKIQAQQTPAGFQPGFGFDAAGEKFHEIDEAGEQGKFHWWRLRSQCSQVKIDWSIL
jgi:hypothetical protein